MQHEAALGIDRPTLEHLHIAGARRQLDHIRRRNDLELHQEIGKLICAAGWLTMMPIAPSVEWAQM